MTRAAFFVSEPARPATAAAVHEYPAAAIACAEAGACIPSSGPSEMPSEMPSGRMPSGPTTSTELASTSTAELSAAVAAVTHPGSAWVLWGAGLAALTDVLTQLAAITTARDAACTAAATADGC